MTAKTVCKTHGRAHPVDEPCPYCPLPSTNPCTEVSNKDENGFYRSSPQRPKTPLKHLDHLVMPGISPHNWFVTHAALQGCYAAGIDTGMASDWENAGWKEDIHYGVWYHS